MQRPMGTDDATNRRLWRLVGPVVVGAGVAVAVALWLTKDYGSLVLFLPLPTVLVTICGYMRIQMRIRSAIHGSSPVSAVIIVAAVFLPAPFVILSVAIGKLADQLLIVAHVPLKISFNVGKEVLNATAATIAVAAFGFQPILVAA